jgi:predicted alpha/beta superfamily hydrolase
MRKIFFLVLIPFLLETTAAKSQGLPFDSKEPQTNILDIKNENGKPYRLVVTLPSGYQDGKEYKVLYYLDAWWLKDLVTGCYRIKSMSSEMEEVILVGISSVGDEKDWHKQRNMDYTPSVYDLSWLNLKIDFGGMILDETNTGGAEIFMQFLKNKIIPTVEKEYKVDADSRGILGHSFGGLLAFYSFVNYNDLFANYILLAPAIWWNDSEIFQDKAYLLSQKEAKMFIAMGTGEINMLKIPLGKLIEEFKSKDNEKLKMTYKQYENATHNSVLPQGIYDGIELLYTKSK